MIFRARTARRVAIDPDRRAEDEPRDPVLKRQCKNVGEADHIGADDGRRIAFRKHRPRDRAAVNDRVNRLAPDRGPQPVEVFERRELYVQVPCLGIRDINRNDFAAEPPKPSRNGSANHPRGARDEDPRHRIRTRPCRRRRIGRRR